MSEEAMQTARRLLRAAARELDEMDYESTDESRALVVEIGAFLGSSPPAPSVKITAAMIERAAEAIARVYAERAATSTYMALLAYRYEFRRAAIEALLAAKNVQQPFVTGKHDVVAGACACGA